MIPKVDIIGRIYQERYRSESLSNINGLMFLTLVMVKVEWNLVFATGGDWVVFDEVLSLHDGEEELLVMVE